MQDDKQFKIWLWLAFGFWWICGVIAGGIIF